MNVIEFREKYPQYEGIDDQELAERLYYKYYAQDISRPEFFAKFEVEDSKVPVTKRRRGGKTYTVYEEPKGDGFGALREFAGGASFQLADEIEAAVRASIGNMYTTEADKISSEFGRAVPLRYEEILPQINDARDKFKESNPGTALALEITGAVIAGGGSARMAGLGATTFTSALRQGGAAAAEGFVYGFGSGNTWEERVNNAGLAMMFGAPFGAAGGALAKYLSPAARASREAFKAEEALKKVKEAANDMTDADISSYVQQRMAQRAMARIQGSEKDARRALAELGDPDDFYDSMSYTLREERAIADELGLPHQKVQDARAASGRELVDYRKVSDQELMDGFTMGLKGSPEEQVLLARRNGRGVGNAVDAAVAPIKRLMINNVGKSYASRFNRGMIRAVSDAQNYFEAGADLQPVKTWLRKELASGNREAVELQRQLLNSGVSKKGGLKKVRKFITNKWGDDMGRAFDSYVAAKMGVQKRYNLRINAINDITEDWFHTQRIPEMQSTAIEKTLHANRHADVSSKQRFREHIKKDDFDTPQQYESVFDTMDDWVDDMLPQINVADVFELRAMGRTNLAKGKNALKKDKEALRLGDRAGSVGRALRERLETEGLDPTRIDNAIEYAHSALFNGNKSPAAIIRAARNLGYSGTIFNPYGAALNVHDVLNASSALGMRNVMGSLFDKTLSAAEQGLANQYAGEYVKRMSSMKKGSLNGLLGFTDDVAEQSAKYSQFRRLDSWGKDRILNAALAEARKEVKKGNFRDRWQYTFSSDELNRMELALKKGEVNDLIKEMAMFRLSEIQPITRLQQTKLSLDHPNARILYMLKNFAIRQADFLRTNFVNEWQKGNRAKAMQFAARYGAYSLGGYSLINEGRQILKFREPDFSPENIAVSSARQGLSVASGGFIPVNDYGWDRFWEDVPLAIAEGLLPPTTIPSAIWKDIVAAVDEDKDLEWETLKSLPVVGPTFIAPMLEAN